MDNPYAAPQGEIITNTTSAAPKTWKQILFSFEGRIPRRQYWGGTGLIILAFLVAFIVVFILEKIIGKASIIILIPAYVFLVWAGLALGIKRWHDRNKSGWWTLIAFVPFIGGIWQFIECGCLRGTEGDNTYGGDPT